MSRLAFFRPLVREAAERSSSLKGWSKKRYWANVSDAFFSEPRRRAKFSDKEEERSRTKDYGRGRASRTTENPRTRTTFMQAPFDAVLQLNWK